MKIVIHPHFGRQLDRFCLAFPAGAWFEMLQGQPPGITHLLEHVLYGHLQLQLRNRGLFAQIHAETSIEFLTIAGSCLPEESELVVECLRRVLSSETWVTEIFESEKRVVANEIAGLRSNPARLAYRRLLQKVFSSPHMQKDWQGEPGQLLELNLRTVMEHWQQVRNSDPVLCFSTANESIRKQAVKVSRPRTLPTLALSAEVESPVAAKGTILACAVLPGYGAALGCGESFLEFFNLRLHPTQHILNNRYSVRDIHYALKSYYDFSLLTVRFRSDQAAVQDEVAQMLAAPFAGQSEGDLSKLQRAWTAKHAEQAGLAVSDRAKWSCAGGVALIPAPLVQSLQPARTEFIKLT